MYRSLHRRDLLTHIACMTVIPALSVKASGSPPKSLFDRNFVLSNRLAASFQTLDIGLPDISVYGAAGRISLARLTGKVRLLPLWTEWCTPCIAELRDFERLNAKYSSPEFEIVSLLTGSTRKLNFAAARQRLARAGAPNLPLLVEPNGGNSAVLAIAPGKQKLGIFPSIAIVDRRGHVRARTTGMMLAAPPRANQRDRSITNAEKEALEEGSLPSIWSTSTADAFIAKLRHISLR